MNIWYVDCPYCYHQVRLALPVSTDMVSRVEVSPHYRQVRSWSRRTILKLVRCSHCGNNFYVIIYLKRGNLFKALFDFLADTASSAEKFYKIISRMSEEEDKRCGL